MRLAILALVAACSTPPLKLELAISDSLDDSCGADTCAGIHVLCPAVASIRIIDPSNPSAPYISQCQPVIPDNKGDLCALAQLTLKQTPLPEQTLEVQVVIYPAADIPTDPATGDLLCPTEKEGLSFDAATGFPSGPIEMEDPSDPTHTYQIQPAIGGRAFYHKGDAETVVTMACNDLGALSSCSNTNTTMVSTTVDDFDSQMSVSGNVASLTLVSAGEPTPDPGTAGGFQLPPLNASELELAPGNPPVWSAIVPHQFTSAVCIEVLADGAMTTATLTCKSTSVGSTVDLPSFRMDKSTLAKLTLAVGVSDLTDGLVIGLVTDDSGLPASGHKVTATPPTGLTASPPEYVSKDELSVDTTALGTTESGIFVSRDAPFGTVFSTPDKMLGQVVGFGGLVEGKVTIVVLQLSNPPVTQ